MKIYDKNGQQRDAAWLKATFGDVQVFEANTSDGADVYRVMELREKCGPASLVVNVRDIQGNAQGNAVVVRFWPGAPSVSASWRSRSPYQDPILPRWHGIGAAHSSLPSVPPSMPWSQPARRCSSWPRAYGRCRPTPSSR